MSVFRIWIVANFSEVRNCYFEIPKCPPTLNTMSARDATDCARLLDCSAARL